MNAFEPASQTESAGNSPPSRMAVILDFVPTNCVLHLQEGDQLAPRLVMGLSPNRRSTIRRPGGETISGMLWSIELYRGPVPADRASALEGIGVVNHYPASDDEDMSHEEVAAPWAYMEAETFDLVRDLAGRGILPAAIRLHVAGLTYDWEPDGSGKVWDTAASPNVPVKKIEVSFALVRSEPPENLPDGEGVVTATQLGRIEHSLAVAIPAQLAELKQYLVGAFIAAVVIATVLVLR